MKEQFKIENLVIGNLSSLYNPPYAPHDTFINNNTNQKFLFTNNDDNYVEVFTHMRFNKQSTEIILNSFYPTVVNEKPIENTYFNKQQLSTGYVNSYDLSQLYNRLNNKRKTKTKIKH